jgi:glutamine synthetase adenylyltransferase
MKNIQGMKKMTEMITITKEQYEELAEAYNFLQHLEAWGVDNWEGYS